MSVFASVPCCVVVIRWERADPWLFFCDVKLCFVTFPCGILGQVWYLMYRFLIFAAFVILVHNALLSNEGSDEHAQMRVLAKTFPTRIHKVVI